MDGRIITVGRHEGLLRAMARAVAWGDVTAMKMAGQLLASFLPDECVLVPMPSHIGYATTMLDLARWTRHFIGTRSASKNGCDIVNCLECDPHESSHIVKLERGVPPVVRMYLHKSPPKFNKPVFIIDNTVATGATASAALAVLPNAKVLAITKG